MKNFFVARILSASFVCFILSNASLASIPKVEKMGRLPCMYGQSRLVFEAPEELRPQQSSGSSERANASPQDQGPLQDMYERTNSFQYGFIKSAQQEPSFFQLLWKRIQCFGDKVFQTFLSFFHVLFCCFHQFRDSRAPVATNTEQGELYSRTSRGGTMPVYVRPAPVRRPLTECILTLEKPSHSEALDGRDSGLSSPLEGNSSLSEEEEEIGSVQQQIEAFKQPSVNPISDSSLEEERNRSMAILAIRLTRNQLNSKELSESLSSGISDPILKKKEEEKVAFLWNIEHQLYCQSGAEQNLTQSEGEHDSLERLKGDNNVQKKYINLSITRMPCISCSENSLEFYNDPDNTSPQSSISSLTLESFFRGSDADDGFSFDE